MTDLDDLKHRAIDNLVDLALAYRLQPTSQTTREIRKAVTRSIVDSIEDAYTIGQNDAYTSLASLVVPSNPFHGLFRRKPKPEDPAQ